MSIHVEIAHGPKAMAAVRRLNHLVYAEELGQDSLQTNGHSLIDPRMEKGVCFVARHEEQTVGMLALTLPEQRFSIEDTVGELPLTPQQRAQTVEIRRLAVLPEWRKRGIYPLLVDASVAYSLALGIRNGVISAIMNQVALYERLGYRSFGERFRKGEAEYQPMLVHLEQIVQAQLDPRLFPQTTRALQRRAG